MNKKKMLIYALAPAALGAGLIGTGTVSAHGLYGMFGMNSLTPDQIATQQQNMFQNEANILGVSVDDVKASWSKGETMQQLATDKGVSQTTIQTNIKNQRLQQLKDRLKALVDKGIITQAQSDARLQFMQNQPTTGNSKGGGARGFGRGMMMGRGW